MVWDYFSPSNAAHEFAYHNLMEEFEEDEHEPLERSVIDSILREQVIYTTKT